MKTFRALCRTALLALCGLLCAACGAAEPAGSAPGSAVQPETPAPSLQTPYVGIVLKSLDNPYFQLIKAGAEDEADARGVEVMVFSPDGEADTDDQADMLCTMADMAVDVIAIAPVDEDALADGLARAARNGKYLLAVDTALDSAVCACYIGTDNYAAAYQQGQYAAGLVEPGACAVILRGQAQDKAHTQREAGLTDALHAAGVYVLDTEVCDSSAELAGQTMAGLLAVYDTIDLVCTTSDSMAAGAQRAIAQAGRADGIRIVSFDGMPEVCELVRAGDIDAVFAQDAYAIGQQCIRAAVQLYQGESVPPTIYTDVTCITAETAQAHIDEVVRRLRHEKTNR